MGGQRIRSALMVFELPVVTTETAIVKKAIVKTEARTQLTAAKKKKAKKASKPKKAKKAKAKKPKKKKKKKKVVKYPGGKRKKGQHKSKGISGKATRGAV